MASSLYVRKCLIQRIDWKREMGLPHTLRQAPFSFSLSRYIFLFTGVIDFLGVYADGLPDAGGILDRAGHHLVRHCNTS